ncbi:MAG: AAA family ATPase [Nanoarchaeota archaeon]|nr:AAA family ATPase [Nanoarchaeota archaeon]
MLTTGSKEIDNNFYYCKKINCIYGKAATGKTNLCHLLASRFSQNKKVVFIDTENCFSSKRIRQFSSEPKLQNIFVIKVKSFEEQNSAIQNLLEIKDRINLVIIDSLSMYYRKEIQQKNQNANNLLSQQFNNLSELTRNAVPIIITCQVYDKLNSQTQIVGGNMVRNWASVLIKLEQGIKRKIILEKHPKIPKIELDFQITTNDIFCEKTL